jgi:hypothetical protein
LGTTALHQVIAVAISNSILFIEHQSLLNNMQKNKIEKKKKKIEIVVVKENESLVLFIFFYLLIKKKTVTYNFIIIFLRYPHSALCTGRDS